jgi:proline iminopeptidase
LALAYAEQFSHHVSELVLFGVTTGRREEFDWVFRDGLRRFFPEEWERRRAALPITDHDDDVVEAYHRLLYHPDPAVCDRAAQAWCLWESATADWPPAHGLAPRFRDASFALADARIVTHYARHDAWLGDGHVLRDAAKLADLPGVLVNGRFDFQAPLTTAWELRRRLPRWELIVDDNAGHAADHRDITRELVRATDRFSKS